MKQRYLLLLLIAGIISFGHSARAQMVGTNIYIPGRYLELGINNVGALGAATPPAGYHPWPAGPLASVYDYGHDGWTVGTPPFYGDYTYPGSPFEGWELQIGTTAHSQAFTTGIPSTIANSGAGATLTGNNISYTDVGGVLTALWQGTAGIGGVLTISQTTRVDTNGGWATVTTVLKNTGSATMPTMYYMRSCDPDNDEAHGGSFATNNTILHQNEDPQHDVEVDAEGALYSDHWSLCTRDCRAVAFIYESWPMSITQDLGAVWNQTYGGSQYTLGGTLDGDYAMGLVFKITALAAHDSTVISYAYIFNDATSTIDSAFPEPQLVVNSAVVDSVDTFNTCSYPGITSVPVGISNATTGVWTYSTWTWAPATGLAATTGVNNTVNLTALSVPVTYTITGTDSVAADCEHQVFYLTIIPCFSASNNGPICQGDTLDLYAHGDSTSATYAWYNASGTLVSTTQNPVIFPTALSDSGLYTVVKTVAGVSDTAHTDVVIKPLPVVSIGSNAPICSGSTLTFTATPDSVGETFSWTGPDGFTSFVPNPVISPAYVINSGVYQVNTTLNGCTDSALINVVVDSTPAVPTAASNSVLCSDSTLLLTATDATPGVTYYWTGPNSFVSGLQNPSITNVTVAASGTYTVVATLGSCADSTTTVVLVNPTPPAPIVQPVTPICSGGTINFTVTATTTVPPTTYTWSGPDGFTSLLQDPTITGAPTTATGVYSVFATQYGCPSPTTIIAVLVDSTPANITASVNTPICQGDTLYFSANSATAGVAYSWTGPLGFSSTLQYPQIDGAPVTATGLYHLTVTLDGICPADTAIVAVVNVIPTLSFIGSNAPLCSGNNLVLNSTFGPTGGTYNWTGPLNYTGVGQVVTVPAVPTTGTGTYSVSETLNGCTSDTATIYVVVDSTPATPSAANNSPVCQGDTLQFTSSDITPGVSYSWSGPGGYTSSLQDPSITNVPTSADGTYTVTVTLVSGGLACTNSAFTNVSITPTPSFTPTSNSPVCTGDTLFLHANGAAGSSYTWTGPYYYYAYSLASDPSIANTTIENAGVYTVTALLNGCTTSEFDTVVINTTPLPPFISWLTYCQYYPAPPLMATGTGITWYLSDTANAPGSAVPPVPQTTLVGSTFYYATQTVNGCMSVEDSIQVTVNPTPTVTVTPVDTGVCPHSTFTITATDTPGIAYYRWYPGLYLSDSTTASVTVNPETNVTYSVVASNQFGCADTATSNVIVYPAALITLGDSVTLYPGDTYTMSPTTNCTSFLWFPPAGLSNNLISDPTVAPLLSTEYYLFGTTDNGCSTEDSINIYLSDVSGIRLPNAFTPGSGANGQYMVNKNGIVTLKYFRIFNRWGQKMFETADINQGWDGTFDGKPQPMAVYVYEVEGVTNEGRDVVLKGNLTLLR